MHKIKADIEQTLADLLDEEQYDDECTEPFFDADKHKEPPSDATREQYALGDEEMERFEKIVLSVRQDALNRAAELENEEKMPAEDIFNGETQVTSELHVAFAQYQERSREDDPEL